MLVAVAGFSFAAVLIVLLPGPDTLVVVRNILRGGRRTGAMTALGNLCGLTVWVGVTTFGLAAALKASEIGYDALRIAGALYLVWLGISTLRDRAAGVVAPDKRAGLLGAGFVAGLLTNLLNPKVGVFFLSFLPGFIPHGSSVATTSLLFGAIFVLLTSAYWVLLLSLASKVTAWMARPVVRRRLNVITGAILIGFGVRLVTE